MQIISGTTQFRIEEPTAVAIGKFDGLHQGHRKLLNEIIAQKEDGLKAAVFTFDPSPEIFFGMNPSRELSTNSEKIQLVEEIGIDILVEFPFNKETAAISPENFVIDILRGRMNAAFVAAGTDLSFGAMGKGNFELMSSLARHLGFEEPYRITGKIVHGRALGRRIGIPTLNQIPPADKLLPPFGVYYSEVKADGRVFKGMTNIGIKPTVTDEHRTTVETYLYHFSGDLYGEYADVKLLTFRRPEKRFADIKELQRTMQEDIRAGEIYHGLV